MKSAKAAALAYAQLGWQIIPIQPGKKQPSWNDWVQRATNDTTLIEEWWTAHPNHGVGIATGQHSNIFVLDVDTAPGKDGEETLHDLQQQHGPLPETLEAITGSGGRHIYYQWPHNTDIRNSASTVLGIGLDIRGNGGQVVAAPTIHPNGTPYAWEGGNDPRTTPIAQAPHWLLELLTKPETNPQARRTKSPNAGNRPGDKWAADRTWPEILEADGATLIKKCEDTRGYYELWARPPMVGEDRYEPHASASLYYKGSDVLKIFSTNWQSINHDTGEIITLEPEQTYTKFGYWTETRHAGDYTAATRAAVTAGYGTPHKPMAERARDAITQPDNNNDDDGYDDPDLRRPIPENTRPPEFPYHVLPQIVNDYLNDWAHATGQSKEMAANAYIGTYSALANHQRHEIVYQNSWTQRLNLFLLITGDPGTGKSPALKAVRGPLSRLRQELEEASRKQMYEALGDLDTLKIAKDRAREPLRNKGEENVTSAERKTFAEADLAYREAEEQAAAKAYKLYAGGDVTPEAFAARLQSNAGNTMSLISEEGGFFSSISRYTKPGSAPDLDALLMSFDGGDIEILRKTSSDIEITGAHSTFLFMIQDTVAQALFNDPVLVGRGLADRFLIVHPPKVKSRRVGRQSQDTLTKQAFDTWMDRHAHPEFNAPKTIRIDPDAEHMYAIWADSYDDAFDEGDLHRGALQFFRKLEQVVLRAAGLLALMHETDSAPVDVDTMHAALTLGDYWMEYRQRFLTQRDATVEDSAASKLYTWAELRSDEFTIREAQRSGCVNATHATSEDLQHLIAQMLKWGWLETSHPDNWMPKRKVPPATFWVTESGRNVDGCDPTTKPTSDPRTTESETRPLSVHPRVLMSVPSVKDVSGTTTTNTNEINESTKTVDNPKSLTPENPLTLPTLKNPVAESDISSQEVIGYDEVTGRAIRGNAGGLL